MTGMPTTATIANRGNGAVSVTCHAAIAAIRKLPRLYEFHFLIIFSSRFSFSFRLFATLLKELRVY